MQGTQNKKILTKNFKENRKLKKYHSNETNSNKDLNYNFNYSYILIIILI
jgi:hypothetical protein